MASTNWQAFDPIQYIAGSESASLRVSRAWPAYLQIAEFIPIYSSRVGNTYQAWAPIQNEYFVAHGGTAMIYLIHGQYGAITETWIGASPETTPPSGHTLTDRHYIALKSYSL